MVKNDLRISRSISELSKDIKSILSKNEDFTIWQNVDGEKKVTGGVINSQFLTSSDLTLEFEIKDAEIIKPKSKIFMLCEKSSVLLKGKIKIINKNKLKVLIDHKFYLKEKRLSLRLDMTQKNIEAVIDRKIELKDSFKTEDVRLKNISSHGAGFYITSSRAVFFQAGSEIKIRSLESVEFQGPIKGVITHVTPIESDFDKNQLMLVGIRFNEEYEDIDTIIQEVELKLLDKNSLNNKYIG